MVSRRMHKAEHSEQVAHHSIPASTPYIVQQYTHQESSRAALTLLLGSDTEYTMRIRATRRLARQGASIVPLFLTTLSSAPEITSPAWPWWPPQYEHCSRLLLYLCQKVSLPLESVLQHSALPGPAGPVLWVCVMEAAGLMPHADHEALLCAGLETPWPTVRYAAAMALATRAGKVPLSSEAIAQLKQHQSSEEAFHVQLTASYALLNCGESAGIEALMRLLDLTLPEEVRHAAAFVLATEFPLALSHEQQEQLARLLLLTLHDPCTEIALLAARALRHITLPLPVHVLCTMLECQDVALQLRVLTALEELAHTTAQRRLMLHVALPAQLVPLLRSDIAELRRQACYTLVALGGEYVMAVLGTIILTDNSPAYLDVIESLRLLPEALHASPRTRLLRWLLLCLEHEAEDVQTTALDSLTHLLWRARTHGQKRVWHELSQRLFASGQLESLLHNPNAPVRQRTAELLSVLYHAHARAAFCYQQLYFLLQHDPEASVRSSIAHVCAEMQEPAAIPNLMCALLDPSERVAEAALSALERMVDMQPSLIPYVVRELCLCADGQSTLYRQAQAALKRWK
jgi:HEAT repeat protein